MFKCSFCDYQKGEMGRQHINIGKLLLYLENENAAICDWCAKHTKEYEDLRTRLEALEKWGKEVAVPGLQGAYKYMDHQTSGGLNAAQLLFKALSQARTLGLMEEK